MIDISMRMFMSAFGADVDYHVSAMTTRTYLDRTNGELLFTTEDFAQASAELGSSAAQEMRKNLTIAKRDPTRYLLIKTMSHGDHHDVLQEFLASKWSQDEARRSHVQGVYYATKSIGYWLKSVDDDDAIGAYLAFAEQVRVERVEDFLHRNGVTDFQWT